MAEIKREPINVQELEARVHLAELRAREVEAENRLITALAVRRDLKLNKMQRIKKFGRNRAKENKE